MATATAFGSITIVDITDVGNFSVYPTSDQPLTITYDPDTNTFNPAIGTGTGSGKKKIKLSAEAFYAGTDKTSKARYVWKRRNGNDSTAWSAIDGIVSATGSILEIEDNPFSWDSSTNKFDYSQVTYMVIATYPDSNSGIGKDLTASGQITFVLHQLQGVTKNCSIIPSNSYFAFNGDGSAKGATTITLTPSLQNVSFGAWKYKKSDGSFQEFDKEKIANNILTIENTDNIFVNNMATIQLETKYKDHGIIKYLYDVQTIVCLKDGAAGDSVVSGILTNDDQTIPAKKDGTTETSAYASAISSIAIYEGNTDVTSNWTIKVYADSSITGLKIGETEYPATSKNNKIISIPTTSENGIEGTTVAVTKMSDDSVTGNVYFVATYKNTDRRNLGTITKTFSLTKVKAGLDGTTPTIYTLTSDSLVGSMTQTGANTYSYSPSVFTLETWYQTGSGSKQRFTDGALQCKVGDKTTPLDPIEGGIYKYTPQTDSNITGPIVFTFKDKNGQELDKQTIVINATAKSIESTVSYYQTSNSNSSNPGEEGWASKASEAILDADKKYLWSYTVITYTDGTTNGITYSDATVIGSYGDSGISIEVVTPYYYLNNNTNQINRPSNDPTTSSSSIETWSTEPLNVTSANRYLWSYNKITYSSGNPTYTTPTILAAFGDTGAAGDSAINVVFGNDAEVIPCTSDGRTTGDPTSISIPFKGFYGTEQKFTTCTCDDLLGGPCETGRQKKTIAPTISPATSANEGSINISIPQNSVLADPGDDPSDSDIAAAMATQRGTLTFTFTVTDGTNAAGSSYGTITKTFTWTKSLAADSVLFQLYPENGVDIISNGQNNVTLHPLLTDGTIDKTNNAGYSWYINRGDGKYSEKLTQPRNNYIKIAPEEVDGFASVKCIASYSGNTYTCYYSVKDLSDPIQVTLISSIGDKLTNGVGQGALYPKIYRGETELDPINADHIISDTKNLPKSDEKTYYLINSSSKTIDPYIWNSDHSAYEVTTWENLGLKLSYQWYFRGLNDAGVDYGGGSKPTDRMIYFDKDIINKKMIFDCKVTSTS